MQENRLHQGALSRGNENTRIFKHWLPEIKEMQAEGKTQRKTAEYYGFRDKQAVKGLLKRERRKERELESGILPRPKAGPRKDAALRDIIGASL